MTDEVAHLVLADNTAQNALLGVGRTTAASELEVHERMVADLVARRGLDPVLEGLPDEAGFAARRAAGDGLSGPELAVLLAHVKLDAKAAVLQTDLPDLPQVADRLSGYFPSALTARHPGAPALHPLRREIIATSLVNQMVDRGGLTYAFVLGEATGSSPADALRAFFIASSVFDLPDLWARIDQLPGALPATLVDEVVCGTHRFLAGAAQWLLTRRRRPLALSAEVERFAAPVRAMRPQLTELLTGRDADALRTQVERLVERGVPGAVALHSAGLPPAIGFLDAIDVAERVPGVPVEDIARMYFTLSDRAR
jgi:glutamate dehydrogenase